MVVRRSISPEDESSVSLPSLLLADILDQSDNVYSDIAHYTKYLKEVQGKGRKFLEEHNRIKKVDRSVEIPLNKISGVDGAYVINRTIAADIYIIASLLLADKEIKPRTQVFSLPPSEHSTRIAQGMMSILEILSMCDSSNDLIIYDGSFVTPLIKLNSLYTDFNKNSTDFKFTVQRTQIETTMDSFRHSDAFARLIKSGKVIAVPKESGSSNYSTKLLKDLGENKGYRLVDKLLLSGILNPGEYVITNFEYDQLHLPSSGDTGLDPDGFTFDYGKEIVEALRALKVMYIKPHSWAPAQRVEFFGDIGQKQIDILAATICSLFISPSIIEPYPLFISDRICKSISESANAISSSTLLKMAEGPDSQYFSSDDLQWIMRAYRTEV